MAKIISIHSFRGGTGKSTTTANLAALLALQGRRVGVVDSDIQSPGIHVLFGLRGDATRHTLNDYLWGRCQIHEAAVDVTAQLKVPVGGRIFLVPSSINPGEIAHVLREGCDARVLTSGLRRLVTSLELDMLLIDTHPGLNEETLLSIAISHDLLIILRPDEQDFEGTGVTIEVASALNVPRMHLLVNRVPAAYDLASVRDTVARTYGHPVVAVLPHADDIMALASRELLTVCFPTHPVTALLQQVAVLLL